MGGLALFLALLQLVMATARPEVLRWVLFVLWTVIGVGALVSAKLLRRRLRAAKDGDGQRAEPS